MKMKTFFLIGFLAICSPVGAQNAIEIATKMEEEKVAAIEKYLAENPEAPDLDTALSILIGSHMSMGKMELVPDLFQKRYDLAPKLVNPDLEMFLQEIVRPYIETSVMVDQKEQGKKFVEQFKKDFSAHQQAEQLFQIVDQFAKVLSAPSVGEKLELSFTATDGSQVNIADYKDKVVLVDFWATSCQRCIAELPFLMRMHSVYQPNGFEVIGISLDHDREVFDQFISYTKTPWPQYFDGGGWEGEFAQRFGVTQLPTTFLVGKDGTIIAKNVFAQELDSLVRGELGL